MVPFRCISFKFLAGSFCSQGDGDGSEEMSQGTSAALHKMLDTNFFVKAAAFQITGHSLLLPIPELTFALKMCVSVCVMQHWWPNINQ